MAKQYLGVGRLSYLKEDYRLINSKQQNRSTIVNIMPKVQFIRAGFKCFLSVLWVITQTELNDYHSTVKKEEEKILIKITF